MFETGLLFFVFFFPLVAAALVYLAGHKQAKYVAATAAVI